MSTPFPTDMMQAAPRAGEMHTLAPGLRRILCPNPSPMTYWGTNTYVLGAGDVTLVDPGPDLAAHAKAILAGLAPGERITRILVTHAHLDHSPLARPMAETCGAQVYAFGGPTAGRAPIMDALVAAGLTTGGEGVDHGFAPDVRLEDGETLDISNGLSVQAIWTPGHFCNHLSFAMGEALLSGDHVMGWASTMISPPDGDLAAFMTSCETLQQRTETRYYPGHGAPIDTPQERLDWLIAHRRGRENDILQALRTGPTTISDLTKAIYNETPAQLLPAAARNVFAHLIDLTTREKTTATPTLAATATFALA